MTEETDREKAVFRVRIRGSVDDVWRELTRTDRPQWAMFNSVLHTDGVVPGAELRMRSKNGRYTAVAGRYIEVEENVRLSHTMRFTTYDDPESTVTYTLNEVDDGVELTLTVRDMTPGTKSTKQMKQGGSFIVKNLKAIVEGGRPTFGARLLFVVFKLAEPFNPRSTRTENWRLPSEEAAEA